MTNVRINDLVFRGGDGQDGFYIRSGGLDGLQDGVDVRRDSVARPGADGDFSVPSFLSSRVVAIGGDCVASSAEKLDHYSTQLRTLQATRGDFKVMFDMPGKSLWGMAHLSDRPTFKPTIWGALADWDIELQFDDPRLFGGSRTFTQPSGDDFLIHHYGNFPSTPLLSVTGAMPTGYTIWGPNDSRFVVTAAVSSAKPHTIDMNTGVLTVAGAVVHGAVTRADTWAVPPGVKVGMELEPASGSGVVVATVRDTFI